MQKLPFWLSLIMYSADHGWVEKTLWVRVYNLRVQVWVFKLQQVRCRCGNYNLTCKFVHPAIF